MTIKLRTVLSGPKGVYQPGIHSLDADMERQLVDGGYAEYVAVAAPAPEREVVIAPEYAIPPPHQIKRNGRR